MIHIKQPDEIEIIRENCLLVCKTLAHVGSQIKPGMTAKELDSMAEEFIMDHGAKPGFKGYNGFPASLCISVNECVVHGIPNDREVQEGDILSIDCGTYMNGYFGDAAYTFAVGEIEEETEELLRVTNESLYLGIDKARKGNRIGDIGFAIQQYAERQHGYGIVRALVGHGLGRNLHEAPEVPNFGKRGRGPKIEEGLVIAIEPMVNLHDRRVVQERDGWTIRTRDKAPSAHFEHTIAVTASGPDILSDHEPIEEVVKNNLNLHEVSLKNTIFALRKSEDG